MKPRQVPIFLYWRVENPNFPHCRRILDIYWQWLLNVRSVLSQCNRLLRLPHLPCDFWLFIHLNSHSTDRSILQLCQYDMEVMWRKAIKHAFSILYSDKTQVFDQSERAQGPIYIIKQKQNTAEASLLVKYQQ